MDHGGYSTAASVDAATTSYRDNADPLRRFVDDCLEVTGRHDDKETRFAVYARYKEWTEENGHKPLGAGRFWPRLHGVDGRIDPTRLSNGVRYVGGTCLKESWR